MRAFTPELMASFTYLLRQSACLNLRILRCQKFRPR